MEQEAIQAVASDDDVYILSQVRILYHHQFSSRDNAPSLLITLVNTHYQLYEHLYQDQYQDIYSIAEKLCPPMVCTPECTAYLSLGKKKMEDGTLCWALSGVAIHENGSSVSAFIQYSHSKYPQKKLLGRRHAAGR